ncbi:MAG: nucleotidyl transferase AbiEii/AbiGii toxin family protein [bacterium]
MIQYNPREYIEQFHLLFLDQLGRKLDKRNYALKGGCNLRFYFKSFRYSEDMDLDVRTVTRDKLRDTVNAILSSKPFAQILAVRGMRIERWSEPKQTETTQQWKLGLAASTTDMLLNTKFEFSLMGMRGNTLFEPIDPALIRHYQLAPILANHYDAHMAYEHKVEALITRKTTQARDIFDLYLLLNSGVEHTISDQKLKKRLHEAQSNAMSITFDIFKSQVLSYLHPDYQGQYDSEMVWEDMLLRVTEALNEAGK